MQTVHMNFEKKGEKNFKKKKKNFDVKTRAAMKGSFILLNWSFGKEKKDRKYEVIKKGKKSHISEFYSEYWRQI